MNLPKFIYLLQESALFLPKMSVFEDHLEGGLTARDYFTYSNDAARIDIGMNALWPLADETIEDGNARRSQAESSLQILKNRTFETPFGPYKCDDAESIFSRCREWIYVNCWHKSPHECSAMWSLYGADNNSVCVFTTVDKLREQIESNNDKNVIELHDVKYINHQSAHLDGNYLSPFTAKSLPFSFEKELRIISYDPRVDLNIAAKNTSVGNKLLIKSLPQLIDEIVISPNSDPWFFDSIHRLCSAHKLNVRIVKSSLSKNRIESFHEACNQLKLNDL